MLKKCKFSFFYPMKLCLELSTFIFLAQVLLRSLSGILSVSYSLEVLIDMEKDVQKLRKNASQKDIRERCLLSCNKMEKEAEILDPVGFERHNTCIEEVHSMKLVTLEAEKNGIKSDKEECLKTIACFKTKLTKLSVN